MIIAKLIYFFKDKKSFENKILPYIFGQGIFYKKGYSIKLKNNRAELIIKTKSLSQLITTSIGMLRYSPQCKLNEIKIIRAESKNYLKIPYENVSKIILGAILKPSLSQNPNATKKIIKFAINNNFQFIKDDDASEYSKKEAIKIKKLLGGIPYFQKISDKDYLIGKYAMIVPWIGGWKLVEEISKKAVTMVHCANLSPQISWNAHIIFSRLAGASFVIVPDQLFDETFDLNSGIQFAKKRIRGLKSIRIIISGGINPKRIDKILKLIKEKNQKYIGFAIGSWILKK